MKSFTIFISLAAFVMLLMIGQISALHNTIKRARRCVEKVDHTKPHRQTFIQILDHLQMFGILAQPGQNKAIFDNIRLAAQHSKEADPNLKAIFDKTETPAKFTKAIGNPVLFRQHILQHVMPFCGDNHTVDIPDSIITTLANKVQGCLNTVTVHEGDNQTHDTKALNTIAKAIALRLAEPITTVSGGVALFKNIHSELVQVDQFEKSSLKFSDSLFAIYYETSSHSIEFREDVFSVNCTQNPKELNGIKQVILMELQSICDKDAEEKEAAAAAARSGSTVGESDGCSDLSSTSTL